MIPTSNQFWGAAYGSSNGTPTALIHHGGLLGLGDDDHLQYLLLLGRAGGQIAYGGINNGDDLTLRSTSNVGKGSILLQQCLDVTMDALTTIEAQIGSVAILTLQTTALTLQKAAAPYVFYYDNYSDTVTDTNYIYFRKSHNDTLGTLTRTIDTEVLARFDFWGVEAGGARREGAIIRVLQNGATAAQVPTDIKFETYGDAAINTDQFTIDHDGYLDHRGNGINLFVAATGAVKGTINCAHFSGAAALPVAAVEYRGAIYTVEGGAGVRDRTYVCLKSDAGVYNWVEFANGGA